MAINDNRPDYAAEKEAWDKYYHMIANNNLADEKGYFWAVKEAKLIEISCVTDGSNELTGIYNPSKDSLNIDPPLSSQKSTSFYSHFLN